MNQDEYTQEISKAQKVVEICKKRLDWAIRSLNDIYNKRSKTIQDMLKFDTSKKYSVTYRISELNIHKTKKGFFNSIEFSPKHENFILRLKPIKKNGLASKIPESINEAVLITDIVTYSEIEE